MSDHWLRYVPKDPRYQPTEDQARAAETLLSSFLPRSESIRSDFSDRTVFVDPGANWSGVHCSSCGADAEPWWGAAMDSAWESNLLELTLPAPCCGQTVSLNELAYGWPCAFGRYVLEAMNPNERGLTLDQARQLAATLGCELLEVPVHL